MQTISFAWMPTSSNSGVDSLLLLRSLRTFGGELADSPAYLYLADHTETLSSAILQSAEKMGARVMRFSVPPEMRAFPFASKVRAAAEAESNLAGKTGLLAWLDADTLVLNPPVALQFPPGKKLGCCPVHHRLIGSRAGQALDDFWRLIYDVCRVVTGRDFAVQTVIGSESIRPYWNAGLLVTAPESGLLQAWEETFERLYLDARVTKFYESEAFYRIFIHQAILAGVSLARLEPDEFEVLPTTYNFPLHLAHQAQAGELPAALEKLVTCRYEEVDFLLTGAWREVIPVSRETFEWLRSNESI